MPQLRKHTVSANVRISEDNLILLTDAGARHEREVDYLELSLAVKFVVNARKERSDDKHCQYFVSFR